MGRIGKGFGAAQLALGGVLAVIAMSAAPSSALAGPVTGRWTGASHGTRIDLTIGAAPRDVGPYRRHFKLEILDLLVVCRRAYYDDGDNTLDDPVSDIDARGSMVGPDSPSEPSGNFGARRGQITIPAHLTTGFDDHNHLRHCSQSSLRHVRMHHVRAPVRRDGQYKASGPLGTQGRMVVYASGALVSLSSVALGTPIGIPLPEEPEENCAVLAEGVYASNDKPIYTTGPGRSRFFSSALNDDEITEVDFFSLHGRFINDHEVIGTYIAHGASLDPPTAPCSGTGRVTMRWVDHINSDP